MDNLLDRESNSNKNVQALLPATSWTGHTCTDGSRLIFSPPGLRVRRRPCVTIGHFGRGRGDLCVHLRIYSQHSPGVIAPTRFGISLTLAEFNIIVDRITRFLGTDAEAAA